MKIHTFNARMSRLLLFMWIVLFLNHSLVFANDPPGSILEKFHTNTTGEEALKYLTGIMESQFSTFDEETQVKWLNMNRLKIDKSQMKQINDKLAFVFITSVQDENGIVQPSAQDYQRARCGPGAGA